MFNFSLYLIALLALLFSFFKDKKKTKQALKKAWKSFENILPQFSAVLLIIGMSLSILTPATVSSLIGEKSGWFGLLIASVIGSLTLIPGFIAFPLAANLLNNGAGITQIAVFVSTLMMVGVITLPLEISYFGKKAVILRNTMAFIFSVIAAFVIGGVLG